MRMYLYLGASAAVRQRDIIGIFDMDNTTSSLRTREFLAGAEKRGELESVTGDLPRSFVLCGGRDGRQRVCLCQLSPAALRSRAENGAL